LTIWQEPNNLQIENWILMTTSTEEEEVLQWDNHLLEEVVLLDHLTLLRKQQYPEALIKLQLKKDNHTGPTLEEAEPKMKWLAN